MSTSASKHEAIKTIELRLVLAHERERYRALMAEHHYLGDVAKIGESLWYVATWRDEWVALLSFSAAALKCAVRDRWIGWDFRTQFGRLPLIANNTRFLILPNWHVPNLGSRVLSLVRLRISADWQARYGHGLLLLETFVDPRRFHGGVYRASNWLCLGLTRGYRRTNTQVRYSPERSIDAAKHVFVQPLQRNTRALLVHAPRAQLQLKGASRVMLSSDEVRSLSACFADIPDPRRRQGRKHSLTVVLSIAAGATLCGMQGYKAMAQWAKGLGQSARERFGCRIENKVRVVPSEYVIRDCLVRIEPGALEHAISTWQAVRAQPQEALAIDGKTMKGAIDAHGHPTHIMSAVGHQSGVCVAQKK